MSDDTLQSRLSLAGITPTVQRMEVAQVLLNRPQHMSADQILDELKRCGSAVSKATVYNTLKLFCANGLAQELNIDPSRTFYDSTTDRHHHFFNEDTGELTDIAPDALGFDVLPELPAGTEPAGVEVLIRIRNR